jgi:SAM-dependent methyltransferase
LETLGVGLPGQRLLDLGTGTGLLARAFALRGCRVTGLDLSGELLAEARRADLAAKVSIDYIQAPAEASGLPAGEFDVISAATCWHWFDRPKVAAEARRLLRPEGRLVIAALDWHARPGNVVDVTRETIQDFSPVPAPKSWNTFQYPAWTHDLSAAGFDDWEACAFTTQLPYSHQAWLGRIRASAGVGPVMDPPTLARFDAVLGQSLRMKFPHETLAVDHMVFALVAWGRN